MNIYPMRPQRRNRRSFAEIQPDLFDWADTNAALLMAMPPAAHQVARRYRVSPHVAGVIAMAAGLGGAE
jgi:hypothetical protein